MTSRMPSWQSWLPGNPLDPASSMGAIVDATQLDGIRSHVARGIEQGARLRLGGEPVLTDGGGCYFPPTVFDRVDNRQALAREEIFGPVLAVIGFDSAEEAIAIANDCPTGWRRRSGPGIWTRR
nr:aldehyde dehydrogenase family protein [Oceanisphaera psychrotolerans]